MHVHGSPMLRLTADSLVYHKASTPEKRKKPMSLFKVDTLLLIASIVALVVGLVLVNTVGVSCLNAANVELPPLLITTQATAPAMSAPVAAPAHQQDNTAAWVTLISTCVMAFFALVGGMFNTWISYKLKTQLRDTQASIDANTVITQSTQTAVKDAVKEGLADKSNVK